MQQPLRPALPETEWDLKFPAEEGERVRKGDKFGLVADGGGVWRWGQSTTGQNVVVDSGTGL